MEQWHTDALIFPGKITEIRGFDMTQEEFTERIDISQNYLSMMKRGKVQIGAEILLRISREFVKSAEWLLTGGKVSVSNLASDGISRCSRRTILHMAPTDSRESQGVPAVSWEVFGQESE
jgi:transcriptional regulator with XRE-family HTH domain